MPYLGNTTPPFGVVICMTLYAIYITVVLPQLDIYIHDNEPVKSDEDLLLEPLRTFLMIIPGVAILKAYKVYKRKIKMKKEEKLWKIKYGYYKSSIGGCFGKYVEGESNIIKTTESVTRL